MFCNKKVSIITNYARFLLAEMVKNIENWILEHTFLFKSKIKRFWRIKVDPYEGGAMLKNFVSDPEGGACRKKVAASVAEGGHVVKSWPRQRPRGGMSKIVWPRSGQEGGGHVKKFWILKNKPFFLEIQFFYLFCNKKESIITNYGPFSLTEMVKNIENWIIEHTYLFKSKIKRFWRIKVDPYEGGHVEEFRHWA